MSDHTKTKGQLIEELQRLRKQLAQLQAASDEYRQAEEALRSQIAEQQIIFDSVPALVWFKDTQNKILRLNRAAAEAMGLSADDIQGKSVYKLNPGEADHYYQDDREVIETGTPKKGIVEPLVAASGETRWLQTDKIPYLDTGGNIAGVIVFATDITERVKAEEALRKAQEELEHRVQERTAELAETTARLREEIAEHEQTGRALLQERDLLQALMDNVPDMIFFKDTETRVIRTNKAHAQFLGYANPQDAVGKTDFDFFSPDEAPGFYAEEQNVMRTRQPVVDRVGQTPDHRTGELRWLSETKVPITDEAGQVAGLVGIARDITVRKLAEDELARRNNQLRTAAEVSRAATGILDPNVLIQQVVNLVHDRFGLYYVGLFLVDGTGEWTGQRNKWAVLRAGTGEAGRQMLTAGHKLEIGGESMIGWCVANRQARIALDVGQEAVRFDNPYLPQTRSEMALPLTARGQVIGAMTVQSEKGAAFSDEDIAVLQTMADQVANVIENTRLFDEQGRIASLLGERVRELDCLNDISRKIDEALPVPEFLGWVAERIPSAMRHPELCTVAIDLEGRIYGTAEAVELPCHIMHGLRVGDEVLGRVYLAYSEQREFLDGDSALLGSIANRVSGYIENRRLFEQTQAALAEVEATHRSYLRGRWQDYLHQQATLHQDGVVYDQPDLGTGTLQGQDTTTSVPRPPEQGRATAEGDPTGTSGHGAERSELIVPIVLRGQTLGMLGLEDPYGARQWSEEDRALVEAVSRQLALALENARLLEETQRRATREQLVSDITNRMRETLDMETILKTAISEIADTLGLARVEVRMKEEGAQPGNERGEIDPARQLSSGPG
jgi:PAS domain S-box-containing protein